MDLGTSAGGGSEIWGAKFCLELASCSLLICRGMEERGVEGEEEGRRDGRRGGGKEGGRGGREERKEENEKRVHREETEE